VPQSAVKVDDVSVGDVDKVSLDPGTFKARVVVSIRESVRLPANAVARVRQSSLLGEKVVELARPTDVAPQGELHDGDVVTSQRSDQMPEVEEVFSALSALLNGGGIGNLQTIAAELSAALAGREATVRSALGNITTLVTALDQRKGDIVRAIDALDSLTATLAGQTKTIAAALDTFTPALTVLADQRAELTRLLTHLATLGKVGARVVNESRADTVASLRLLSPILEKVVAARGDLAKALDQLLLLTKLVPRAIPGDYLQLYVEVFLKPPNAAAKAPARKAPAAAPAAPRVPAGDAALAWLVSNGVSS
jgi:phospholipid/cholesterol/gamma-HCH transport system substrate-binding protein